MATVKVVLSKERRRKCGGFPVVVQILHQRRKRVIYLGYTLKENNFDATRELAVFCKTESISRMKISELNDAMTKVKVDLLARVTQLENQRKIYTVEDVVSTYRYVRDNTSLFVYMQNQIVQKRIIGRIGIANAYQTTLNSLTRFLNSDKIPLNQITYKFIIDYENYLFSTGVVRNTVSYYMRNLRTIYNRACNEGLIEPTENPFRRVTIQHTRTIKRAIPKGMVQRIYELDLTENARLDAARDLFMFSFYTRGMSFIDVVNLKHSDISDGVIYYCRHKTHQMLQVTITEPLQKLIEKYDTDATYVLPFIGQADGKNLHLQYKSVYNHINYHLKKIANLLEIQTPLTTYVARHSWAMIAKESGATIAAISEGLGHTSEKTTGIYLRDFDRSVIDNINMMVVSF